MNAIAPNPDRLIELFGGPTHIGAELEISPQAVSMWRNTGVPNSRRKYFKLKDPSKYAAALSNTAQAATENVAEQGA